MWNGGTTIYGNTQIDGCWSPCQFFSQCSKDCFFRLTSIPTNGGHPPDLRTPLAALLSNRTYLSQKLTWNLNITAFEHENYRPNLYNYSSFPSLRTSLDLSCHWWIWKFQFQNPASYSELFTPSLLGGSFNHESYKVGPTNVINRVMGPLKMAL